MEGRVALVVGRLGVAAAAGPAVGLVAFLFWPGVVEAGRLVGAAAADTGLVFVAAGLAGVEADGFMLKRTKRSRKRTMYT